MNERFDVVMDNLYARRSIRRYVEGRPVEREKIELLLRAAMAAPSACNLQPWEFVIVQGPEDMAALKAHVPGGPYNAPMAVVVCARAEVVPWEGNGWQIDCAAAIENMLLAACAMGLGSVWIGDFDDKALARLLSIPEGVALVNVVYFGYPAERKAPVSRYKEEAVYWGRYDPDRPHAPRTIEGMIQESIQDSRLPEDRT